MFVLSRTSHRQHAVLAPRAVEALAPRQHGLAQSGGKSWPIVVDGDPATNISDIRKVVTVVKDGLIYHPAEHRWTSAPPPPTRRDHLAAAAAGGVVYAIGGRPVNPDRNFDAVEAFDPATSRWTARAPMPTRRGGLEAVVLDGKIHVLGGESRGGVFANHEVYDPAADRWTGAEAMPAPRHGLAVVAIGRRLFVVGGGPRAGFAQTHRVDVYTPGGVSP